MQGRDGTIFLSSSPHNRVCNFSQAVRYNTFWYQALCPFLIEQLQSKSWILRQLWDDSLHHRALSGYTNKAIRTNSSGGRSTTGRDPLAAERLGFERGQLSRLQNRIDSSAARLHSTSCQRPRRYMSDESQCSASSGNEGYSWMGNSTRQRACMTSEAIADKGSWKLNAYPSYSSHSKSGHIYDLDRSAADMSLGYPQNYSRRFHAHFFLAS